MQKKVKFMSWEVLAIFVIIVIMIVAGSMELKDVRTKQENQFDEITEVNVLLDDMGMDNVDILLVLNSIDNFYKNGKYEIDRDVNILDKVSNRQLLIMENIISDGDILSFVVLGSDGKTVLSSSDVTGDATYAYYPYDKFNVEYKKLFGEDFDRRKAKTSGNDNEYDNNSDYVYYENRRSGANGLSGDVVIDKIGYDSDGDCLKAEMTVNYSARMSDNLGYSSDDMVLEYKKDKDNRVIKSLVVK